MAFNGRPSGDDNSGRPAKTAAGVTFLVVYCPECDRQVLTASDLDGEGRLVDVCVHCDRRLDRGDSSARWVDKQQLIERGYFVDGPNSPDQRHGGGGCRDGACGVKQPDSH